MDLVSTAIIAAISAGIGEPIKDAYNTLKEALQKKFGKDSDVVDAVVKLEKKKDSESRQGMLKEEIEATKAYENDELKQLAEVLLKKLQETSEGKNAVKKYNIKAGKIGVVGDHAHISGGQHF